MEKIEMLEHESITLEEEVTNGESSDAGVPRDEMIDFSEVIGVEDNVQIIETQEVETSNPSAEVAMEKMEDNESVEEIPEAVEVLEAPEQLEEVEKTVVGTTQESPEDMDVDENAEKTEPDTEAVSEDEFPTEVAAKVTLRYHFVSSMHSQSL